MRLCKLNLVSRILLAMLVGVVDKITNTNHYHTTGGGM